MLNTKLRKEEKEAWVETTKNIDLDRKELQPEMTALKKLMMKGQLRDESSMCEVDVVDRIKEDYLEHVNEKLGAV